MLVSRRDFAIACATTIALAMLVACKSPHNRGDTQPSVSALPSNQQEGVSHQGDMGPRAAFTPGPSIAETRDTSSRPHRGTDGVSLAAGRAEASLVEPYCDGPRRGAFESATAGERWTSR